LKTSKNAHTEMIRTYVGVNKSGFGSYFTLRLKFCVNKMKGED